MVNYFLITSSIVIFSFFKVDGSLGGAGGLFLGVGLIISGIFIHFLSLLKAVLLVVQVNTSSELLRR